ncbi:hypothetical protein Golob_024878, partial [Gossypium lobatum]|nr:hypothetical protein [Gossypium lobatum]
MAREGLNRKKTAYLEREVLNSTIATVAEDNRGRDLPENGERKGLDMITLGIRDIENG